MAVPRVFVSSTWYDLRYIRENLKYFIKSLGYEPVLSEEGSVFFDPRVHVQDGCVAEMPNCQMLVLVIGGRHGSSFKGTPVSVTNAEYREAVRLKIPIFALVEQGVHNDLQVHASNRGNPRVLDEIRFPSVDATAVFDFIEEVRSNAVNNALVPFRDFADIESYLRQQWAGMMFSFLSAANESARVTDTLVVMREMSERIEMLSRQILRSVGTDAAKMTAALYDTMVSHVAPRELQFIGCRPTPAAILQNDTFAQSAEALGVKLKIVSDKSYSMTGDGEIDRRHLETTSNDYLQMRQELLRILEEFGVSPEQYLAGGKQIQADRDRSEVAGEPSSASPASNPPAAPAAERQRSMPRDDAPTGSKVRLWHSHRHVIAGDPAAHPSSREQVVAFLEEAPARMIATAS